MKKIQQLIDQFQVDTTIGLSLKMGVSGYKANYLPTTDGKKSVPLNKIEALNEIPLKSTEILLQGKLVYKHLVSGDKASEEYRAKKLALLERKQMEVKKAEASILPIEGFFEDSLIEIKAEAHFDKPLVILLNSSLKGELHTTIHMKRSSSAKLIIFSQQDMKSGHCVQIIQDAYSKLDIIWIPMMNSLHGVFSLANDMADSSEFNLSQINFEVPANFLNVIRMNGQRCRVHTSAPVYGVDNNEYKIESTIYHYGKNCYSRINNRGVLRDKAVGKYLGRQIIDSKATGTDSYQESRFLVLNKEVKAYTYPLMVIDTHDLVAGHGSTVAGLDEEQLYYIMSRGLSRKEAELLLTMAYIRPSIEATGLAELSKVLLDKMFSALENRV